MTILKKQNRIALVIRLLPNRSGGAERLFCELANMLTECGQDVTCIYYDEARGEPFYRIEDNVKIVNINSNNKRKKSSYRIPSRLKKYYRWMMKGFVFAGLDKKIWEYLNQDFVNKLQKYFIENNIDLAISFLPTANTVTLLASRETATKVIVSNHNVPKQDYASPFRWDPNPYDMKLRLSSLAYADAIHVLFPGFASWFPRDLQPKITAIPNYVSEEFNTNEVCNVKKDNIILAVGRLAPVKNYIVLLEAWRLIYNKFPDWKVVIYGDGPQKAMLEAKIKQYGLQGSFLLRGHKANLAQDYAGASIFCHPALFEGFGLSVAEALSFRIPVIAFADCDGVNEYVKDGFNGVLVSRIGGSVLFSRAIERLIQSEAERLKLGGNGPLSISEYTRQKYFSNWCELIEKVMG